MAFPAKLALPEVPRAPRLTWHHFVSFLLWKASSVVQDQQKLSPEESESSPPLVKCGSAYEPENQGKDFLHKTFSDPHSRKVDKAMAPDCQLRAFHLQSSATDPKLEEQIGGMNWTSSQGPEERNEYLKKVKSILNIVKEGQISLLVSMN